MPLVSSASGLEALDAHWLALESAVRLPTQTRAWMTACAERFHAPGDLAIVSAAGGRALAPLARRGPRLELLGVWEHSEPSDFVAADDAALAELTRAITALRQPLRLDRVPADSPTIQGLEAAGGGRVVVRPHQGSPWIPLDPGWKEPEAKLTSRRRSDLRRARKRAEKEGGSVHAEVLSPGPDDLDDALRVAWDVEARSWRAARDGAMAQDPLRGPFFRRWAELASAAGTLRIALLHAGETPIAMQLATVAANGYWLLKIGFDEAWKRCSPGMLLIAETIRHAAVEGLAAYELMGVVEDWTHVWTDHVRECVSVRTYPASLSGAQALVGDGWVNLRSRLGRSNG